MLLGSPVGDKSRVLTQPHLTATDSRASTIQWIGFLNDHFYDRSNIAAPAELSIPFCLMKNSLLYRSAWPGSSRQADFATPVWCGAWFGPDPTSGQYSQVAGTKRKTSPSTATWQTDGNDR